MGDLQVLVLSTFGVGISAVSILVSPSHLSLTVFLFLTKANTHTHTRSRAHTHTHIHTHTRARAHQASSAFDTVLGALVGVKAAISLAAGACGYLPSDTAPGLLEGFSGGEIVSETINVVSEEAQGAIGGDEEEDEDSTLLAASAIGLAYGMGRSLVTGFSQPKAPKDEVPAWPSIERNMIPEELCAHRSFKRPSQIGRDSDENLLVQLVEGSTPHESIFDTAVPDSLAKACGCSERGKDTSDLEHVQDVSMKVTYSAPNKMRRLIRTNALHTTASKAGLTDFSTSSPPVHNSSSSATVPYIIPTALEPTPRSLRSLKTTSGLLQQTTRSLDEPITRLDRDPEPFIVAPHFPPAPHIGEVQDTCDKSRAPPHKLVACHELKSDLVYSVPDTKTQERPEKAAKQSPSDIMLVTRIEKTWLTGHNEIDVDVMRAIPNWGKREGMGVLFTDRPKSFIDDLQLVDDPTPEVDEDAENNFRERDETTYVHVKPSLDRIPSMVEPPPRLSEESAASLVDFRSRNSASIRPCDVWRRTSLGSSSVSLDLPTPFASFALRSETIEECNSGPDDHSQRALINIMPCAALIMPSVQKYKEDQDSEVDHPKPTICDSGPDDHSQRVLINIMPSAALIMPSVQEYKEDQDSEVGLG